MFYDIPRNVWRHSPEYIIPPIPRVPRIPRIPFPVLVFLVLYIVTQDHEGTNKKAINLNRNIHLSLSIKTPKYFKPSKYFLKH